jgi:hypothetical protein
MRRTPRSVPVLSSLLVAVLLPVLPASAAAPEPVDPARTACPPDRVQSAGFSDVPPGDSTALAIDCVAGYGIAQGRSDGSFARGAPVTRAQMALFLDRVTAYALQASGSSAQRDASDAGFDDLGAQPRQVRDAVNRLAAEGVAQGSDPDGDGRPSFRPGEPVARGQMAAFLRRTLGSVETLLTGELSEGPRSDTDYFTDDSTSVFEDDINAVADVGDRRRRDGHGVPPRRARDPSADGPLPRTSARGAGLRRRLPEPLRRGRPAARPGARHRRSGHAGRPDRGRPRAAGAVGAGPAAGGGALVSERDSALLKRVDPNGAVTSLGQVPGVVPGARAG